MRQGRRRGSISRAEGRGRIHHLGWLPAEETILFDRGRIFRRIDIDLAEDASLLLCEIVVFGRSATRGEDAARRIRRSLAPAPRRPAGVRRDHPELDGDIGAKLKVPAIGKGGVAIGTALIVPGDEALVERRIREASRMSFGGRSRHLLLEWICNGSSFCAQDAARLRADMMAVLRPSSFRRGAAKALA